MKKLGLIISALALVLGLSQCTKKPNMPTFSGEVEYGTKTITFTTNGNGNKGDFIQNGGLLNYAWNKDKDVIHVYLENTAGNEFNGGTYLGEMRIISLSGDYSATFQGRFTTDFPEHGMIRFVHCGNDVSVTDGASNNVDFSTQDGSKATISSNVIAVCDKEITEGCTYKFDNCDLTVQFGVVRFTFSEFDGNDDITVSRIAETGLKLNEDGTIKYLKGSAPSMLLNDITESNKGEYYAVFMPKVKTTYKFTDGNKVALKDAKIDAGVFYTKKDHVGESVVLDMLPEGAIPGYFSTSDDQIIYFSKGNLQYIGAGASVTGEGTASSAYWRFANNQFDIMGCNDGGAARPDGNVTYITPASGECFNYCYQECDQNETYGKESCRDMFAYGCTGYKDDGDATGWQTKWDPWVTKLSYNGYGNSTYLLSVEYKSDWGYLPIRNGGNQNSMWRTLTTDDWSYVLSEREDAEKLRGFATVNGVKGLILMPNGWIKPDDVEFVNSEELYAADPANKFDANSYNAETWAVLDDLGALFLPCGGKRAGTGISLLDQGLYYCADAPTEAEEGYYGYTSYSLSIAENDQKYCGAFPRNKAGHRYDGYFVRLVFNKNN